MTEPGFRAARIAVLVPCRDEAASVTAVVTGFRRALPRACVYVYDNGSSDDTAALARAAGAVVRHEPIPGKGRVVRRMFAEIEADVYVVVDGDGTYDPSSASNMVERLTADALDMVVGARQSSPDGAGAYPRGHALGNGAFSFVLRRLFGGRLTDVLSGYRVLSRRFVKSFPISSSGFEIETEMTAHALDLDVPIAEVPTPYAPRPDGSASKLRTLPDGARIVRMAVVLVKELRPVAFFSGVFLALTLLAFGLAAPVFREYLATGLVPRFPTAILAAAIEVVAVVCLAAGIVLSSVRRGRLEAKRLAYLALPAPG